MLTIMREVSLIENISVSFPCGVIMYEDLIKTTQRNGGLLSSLTQHSDDDDIASKNELRCKQSAQKAEADTFSYTNTKKQYLGRSKMLVYYIARHYSKHIFEMISSSLPLLLSHHHHHLDHIISPLSPHCSTVASFFFHPTGTPHIFCVMHTSHLYDGKLKEKNLF